MNLCKCIFYALLFLVLNQSFQETHSTQLKFLQRWETIESSQPIKNQTKAIKDLIKRLLPDMFEYFNPLVYKTNTTISKHQVSLWTLESSDDSRIVYIKGNTGIAVAWGLYHYLKYYCNGHVSWDSAYLELPEKLPKAKFSLSSIEKFIYWENVCTFGYTQTFWTWKDWEKHIDWMALNGINVPLAFVGQEAIWYKVFKKLGLNDTSIFNFLSGPEFLPWNRMGNMNGFGGPLSKQFLEGQKILQQKILSRMRSLGMTPILPAFAGYVPKEIGPLYNVSLTKMGPWNGLGHTYLLDFTNKLFKQISKLFIEELINEYGTDHLYNCDTFNEVMPKSANPNYLSLASRTLYAGILKGDDKALWVMQGWLFLHEEFWKTPQIKAFLTANPIGSMLMLDLDSSYLEQYTRTEGYYGQPFIFIDLNNYGGAVGYFGRVSSVNNRLFQVRAKYKNLVGIGLAPEGTSDAYAPAEFTLEMAWRTKKLNNIGNWFKKYSNRRYGHNCMEESWSLMSEKIFNASGYHFNRLKTLVGPPKIGMQNYVWYPLNHTLTIWNNYMSCILYYPQFSSRPGFRYDLVDITRQVLSDFGPFYYQRAITAYKNKNISSLTSNVELFMDVLKDLDKVLNGHSNFMLGPWLKSAQDAGSTKEEKDLFEYNARNQITLWGPRGQILDYAAKEWGGLISHYYIPRWELFFNALINDTILHKPFSQKKFQSDFMKFVGKPFCKSTKKFPVIPTTDPIETTVEVYDTWSYKFNNLLSAP